jgi:hypothetical protein
MAPVPLLHKKLASLQGHAPTAHIHKVSRYQVVCWKPEVQKAVRLGVSFTAAGILLCNAAAAVAGDADSNFTTKCAGTWNIPLVLRESPSLYHTIRPS